MKAMILKSEVKWALAKMKVNKTPAPDDDIVIEILVALYNLGTNYVTKVIREIYDSGEIPEDLHNAAKETRHEWMKNQLNEAYKKMNNWTFNTYVWNLKS